jgi:hypothetical protein
MGPILSAFDRQFELIDSRSRELLAKIGNDQLFLKPRVHADQPAIFSCGEYLLRSAAMVEKTFGGITTRLWDDPFEWTLPEKLGTTLAVLQYLDEVEATRRNGFSFFASDADLTREMPAPDKLRTIHDILLDTLVTASHFQGRAFAVFQMISAEKLPRL